MNPQEGYTALMWACMEGQLEVMHALLAAGVDTEATDEQVGGRGMQWGW